MPRGAGRAERFAPLDKRRLISQSALAHVLQELGRLAEAEGLYRQALETAQQQPNPDNLDLASVCNAMPLC